MSVPPVPPNPPNNPQPEPPKQEQKNNKTPQAEDQGTTDSLSLSTLQPL